MAESSREELMQKVMNDLKNQSSSGQYFTEVALPGVKPDDVNRNELTESK